MNRYLAWALCVVAVSGCAESSVLGDDPAGWRRVEIERVISLALPPELSDSGARGVDSVFRAYRSDRLTVSIDYGAFANPLERIEGQIEERGATEVGERAAVELLWRLQGAGRPWQAGVHVPRSVPGTLPCTVWVEAADEPGRRTGIEAARSLRFLGDARHERERVD